MLLLELASARTAITLFTQLCTNVGLPFQGLLFYFLLFHYYCSFESILHPLIFCAMTFSTMIYIKSVESGLIETHQYSIYTISFRQNKTEHVL